MKQNFTDDDIIRFLYDEMGPSESEAFLDMICDDEALWERYEYFQEVVEKTSRLQYQPAEYSCDQIMAFVKETRPEGAVANTLTTPDKRKKALVTYLMGAIPVTLSLNAFLILVVVLFASVTITGSVYQLSLNQTEQIDKPLVHQTLEEDIYDWDDHATEHELNSLRDDIESIRESSSL